MFILCVYVFLLYVYQYIEHTRNSTKNKPSNNKKHTLGFIHCLNNIYPQPQQHAQAWVL